MWSCLLICFFINFQPHENWLIVVSFFNLNIDLLSWRIVTLTLFMASVLMCVIKKVSFEQANSLTKLVLIVNLVSTLTFLSSSYLIFYFIFEISIVPIALIILGWGYQPERFHAMIAITLYTIICSLPLLIMISVLTNKFITDINSDLTSSGRFFTLFLLLKVFLTLRFLVKFPIFFVHLWLPKAHVEAPVIGSILLAAILLKLAGLGLWRFRKLLQRSQILRFIQRTALLGGAVVGILCLRQIDIKIIIAYSSVRHIRFVIALILNLTKLRFIASLMIIVSHGVSSSIIFARANFIYEILHSRNLSLINGLLRNWPKFSFFWFIACAGNIGTPPTLNFFSEVWGLVVLASTNLMLIVSVGLVTFFAVAFTLVIYARSSQGQFSSQILFFEKETHSTILCSGVHSWFIVVIMLLFI